MDSQLRKLERQARQTNDPDDMFSFFQSYRRAHPSPFKSRDSIPLEKTCTPAFCNLDYAGYKVEIEIHTQRKLIILKL